MKRLMLSGALSALIISLAVSACFGGPWGDTVSANARFMNWPTEENVIHVIGTVDSPSDRFEGGWVATVGRGSPILFGFEHGGASLEDLLALKEDPNHYIRLRIDGEIVADSLEMYYQDPFIAEPGIGPDWTWDHDGDSLGDGNGNGVDDWNGPVMFWRFAIRPRLDLGDHIWQLEVTFDDWATEPWISNGILSVV